MHQTNLTNLLTSITPPYAKHIPRHLLPHTNTCSPPPQSLPIHAKSPMHTIKSQLRLTSYTLDETSWKQPSAIQHMMVIIMTTRCKQVIAQTPCSSDEYRNNYNCMRINTTKVKLYHTTELWELRGQRQRSFFREHS